MESSHNNSSQSSTSPSESPSNEKAPNLDSSNLPTETKPDITHIVITDSTDISGPSISEMPLLESPEAQPITINNKPEGVMSISARKKAASCFPANSQSISKDNQSVNKLISDLPQMTMEVQFDLSDTSRGNMYSKTSQESSIVFNERAIPNQVRILYRNNANNVLEGDPSGRTQ